MKVSGLILELQHYYQTFGDDELVIASDNRINRLQGKVVTLKAMDLGIVRHCCITGFAERPKK